MLDVANAKLLSLAAEAGLAFDPGAFAPVGRGAGGVVRGQEVTIGRVSLDGKAAMGLRGVVLDGSETSLLGQNYLRRLDVSIRGDTMTLR